MKNIVVFNTGVGSQNMGDYIIVNAFRKEMNYLLNGSFVVEYPTHTPVGHSYQQFKKNPVYNFTNNSKYKFITGTNIVKKSMLHPWSGWNINIFNCKFYKDCILVGVGSGNKFKKVNLYTKILYKKILSKDKIHSTRDEKTKLFLESLGFKAINTGCITTWDLNSVNCSLIPNNKSDKVIFTLTDYAIDRIRDQKLIDILLKNYSKIYFWVQGSNDYNYFKTLNNIDDITIVNPNLKSYVDVLDNNNIDYVGTRLHAGICAMKRGKRSIILSVDNRTLDMKETCNINILNGELIDNLEELINSEFKTDLNINNNKIEEWKGQFK